MSKEILLKRNVLFGDCDPEGIVYTPRFSYFAVEAIGEATDIWFKGTALKMMKDLDIIAAARGLKLEFLRRVEWGITLNLKVSVVNVGKSSFSFLVEGFLPTDELAFTAELTQVCISSVTKQKIDIPQGVRDALS